MPNEERLQGSSDEGEYTGPPLSRCEELLNAHPDIHILRSEYRRGEVEITQKVGRRWRHIEVDVRHEEGSQRHYPTVMISAYETPRYETPYNNISRLISNYGLTTLMKLHVEDDEQVTPEVGYQPRQRYPQDFTKEQIRDIESYANPIPAQDIVATVRTGLEILKAYGEASYEQKCRISYARQWDDVIRINQLWDGEPGRDMDTRIAEAAPLFAHALRSAGISYAHVGTKAIYALNALNKVTDAMLPQEMPPVPQNRREQRRRTTSPAPGRRPAGR